MQRSIVGPLLLVAAYHHNTVILRQIDSALSNKKDMQLETTRLGLLDCGSFSVDLRDSYELATSDNYDDFGLQIRI